MREQPGKAGSLGRERINRIHLRRSQRGKEARQRPGD
jgi:hypothetical protein